MLDKEQRPKGLLLPVYQEGKAPRPASLRYQDRKYAADVLSSIIGEEITWQQIFSARNEFDQNRTREAYLAQPTEWEIE